MSSESPAHPLELIPHEEDVFSKSWTSRFIEVQDDWESFTSLYQQFIEVAREAALQKMKEESITVSLNFPRTASNTTVNSQKNPAAPCTLGGRSSHNHSTLEVARTAIDTRPSSLTIREGGPVLTYDAREASRIQMLYRRSKKRAIRRILEPNAQRFSGGIDHCEAFFKELTMAKDLDCEAADTLIQDTLPHIAEAGNLDDKIKPEEVAARLKRAANTAPGADKLEYKHLRAIDPSGSLLALIMNICLKHQRILHQWKESHTVLIHKKGDTTEAGNFRPIALLPTIYKIFSGIIAARLMDWARLNNVLSPEQKGFIPNTEGCMEQTFLLETAISEGRRRKLNLAIAWLDLQNAFGSIPHEILRKTWIQLGIPPILLGILHDIYCGPVSSYQTNEGPTRKIPMEAGVRQGDPLSAILFNIVMEILLRRLKTSTDSALPLYDTELVAGAFADDLVMVSPSVEGLQHLLDTAFETASTIGLRFRPDKCMTLYYETGQPGSSEFFMDGRLLPQLGPEVYYTYLGTPQGFGYPREDLDNAVRSVTNDLKRIEESLLAPWQKLDAFKTAIQPRLYYIMRASYVQKKTIRPLITAITDFAKTTCHLSKWATNHFLHAERMAGGLQLIDLHEDCDILTITQAVRILSSKDVRVARVARRQLQSILRRVTRRPDVTREEEEQYLSGLPMPGTTDTGDIRTLWSRCRAAARRLKVLIKFADEEGKEVTTLYKEKNGTDCYTNPSSVTRMLRQRVAQNHTEELTKCPDQGKVARELQNDRRNISTHWMQTGVGIRFCDWRFIHKARLNLCHTRHRATKWKGGNGNCRKCGAHKETLPHILNHCKTSMLSIRHRHDTIVKRLVNSIPSSRRSLVVLDQHVPQDPVSRRRPDIYLQEENGKIIIVDVAVPFENGGEALKEAANEKNTKYLSLVQTLKSQGKDVSFHAFIIGALGAWMPENESCLNSLGVAKRYRSLFRRMCVSDTIRGSRDIYIEFVTGQKQWM